MSKENQAPDAPLTIAFDVYGTLIDTQGVLANLKDMVADQATLFSQTWRDKQLEYSFRRGLMQNYVDFATCTSQALDFTCQYYSISLSASQKLTLLETYKRLPAFNDVRTGLNLLKKRNIKLFAFSNGSAMAIQELLNNADISDLFDGIISCDDIKSFKPNPAVYTHFLNTAKASSDSTWLISSNPFDVIGALSANIKAAWVKRTNSAVFDPWGIEPTTTINTLLELHDTLLRD